MVAADAEHSEDISGAPFHYQASISSGEGTRPLKTLLVNGVPYERVRKVGKGGSAKVYEVRSTLPGGPQRLALKRVAATSGEHFEALANEVKLLRQLKDCPHVIQVFDAEVLPERSAIHIVMELGEMDLGRMLQARPNLSLGDVQVLWSQMLEAVQGIHDARIVHSDLKPANFLLAGGRLKLIDFGIAKRIACETTHITRETPLGTISYMAPEALLRGPSSLKMGRPSDIWSLGIILYQMVYRRSPFAHLAPMQRAMALADPSMAVPFPPGHSLEGYSEATKAHLIDVLRRCLFRDPQGRATIPELLAHPFLDNGSRQVTRSSFDRALEAMVDGFYRAAREAALATAGSVAPALDASAVPPAEGESHDEEEKGRECWQALSDEVWASLSSNPRDLLLSMVEASSAGQQAPAATHLVAPFRECLQRWLTRGAKRQRTEASVGASARADTAPPPRGPGPGSGAERLPRATCPPVRNAAAARAEAANVVLKRLKDRRAVVAGDRGDEEPTSFTRWGGYGA